MTYIIGLMVNLLLAELCIAVEFFVIFVVPRIVLSRIQRIIRRKKARERKRIKRERLKRSIASENEQYLYDRLWKMEKNLTLND